MKCKKCNTDYPPTDLYFRKAPKCKAGIVSTCKICDRERARQYRANDLDNKRAMARESYHRNKNKDYNKKRVKRINTKHYSENREDRIKSAKEWNDNHKEHRSEYLKEYRKTYEKVNADIIRKRKKLHRENNPEAYKQRRRNWVIKNPDRNKIIKQRRRSREKLVLCCFDIYDWQRCLDYFNNKCAYCGKDRKLQQDHFIALEWGGEYTKNNIIPACKPCNSSKQEKNFFVWYPEKSFYSIKREKKILKYLNYNPSLKTQQLKLVI